MIWERMKYSDQNQSVTFTGVTITGVIYEPSSSNISGIIHSIWLIFDVSD